MSQAQQTQALTGLLLQFILPLYFPWPLQTELYRSFFSHTCKLLSATFFCLVWCDLSCHVNHEQMAFANSGFQFGFSVSYLKIV